jgi:GTP cyclohydrolase IA
MRELTVSSLKKQTTKSFDKKRLSKQIDDWLSDKRLPKSEQLVRSMLEAIGENPDREGLRETPSRVVRAWGEWFSGYKQDPELVLKTFRDGAELCGDEMVMVRDIEVYSFCEHHMAPFFGTATVAYIPSYSVVGLSKLARLVDVYARRLQVQERLTNQVANAIQEHLRPQGVGVVLRCTHFCMCSRGVGKQGSTTITSALRGAIKNKPEARAEFMGLALAP